MPQLVQGFLLDENRPGFLENLNRQGRHHHARNSVRQATQIGVIHAGIGGLETRFGPGGKRGSYAFWK
jgi:hypothetical protein